MADDRDAFIRTIIAKPDDDLPRLVFADWLDEHGQGERAEFVRVQCELARIISELRSDEPCDTPGCDCKSLDALRRRERELLTFSRFVPSVGPKAYSVGEAWMPDWLMRIIEPPAGLHSHFVRGFLESITCSWSDWQRHADAIRKATPLRKVRLTTMPPWTNEDILDWNESETWGEYALRKIGDPYPGIEFELPTHGPSPLRHAFAANVARPETQAAIRSLQR